MKELKDIKNILIIGCGTLGLRIGLRCAMDGFNVKMYDVTDEALQKARSIQDKLLRSFVKKEWITEGVADAAQNRITTTTDKAEAVKNIDLVSESVTEDLEIKKKSVGSVRAFVRTKYGFDNKYFLFVAVHVCKRNGATAFVLRLSFSRCFYNECRGHHATPEYGG